MDEGLGDDVANIALRIEHDRRTGTRMNPAQIPAPVGLDILDDQLDDEALIDPDPIDRTETLDRDRPVRRIDKSEDTGIAAPISGERGRDIHANLAVVGKPLARRFITVAEILVHRRHADGCVGLEIVVLLKTFANLPFIGFDRTRSPAGAHH